MAEVSIRLLGGFEARVGAVPVDGAWRLRKARELVKLLALARGHRLHREQAMDELWPDLGPAAAANNLNQVVHVARRALGRDALVARDELLELAAAVDADEFERAAAEARRVRSPRAYAAALELYRGELLPENRYDDWCAARREELAELRDTLAAELEALGGEAVGGARRLPPETSSFVGRGHELAELRALLARTRLLTLTGTGGAGKTRLALELARQRETSFADGVAVVALADVAEPKLVPAAAAAALDVRALPGRPLVDALVELLASRELLLVLDNCEHVLAEAAALAETLLRGAPRLTVVATSREPLRVPSEVVFRVPSLPIADPDRPLAAADLLRFEGVRLFVERAAAAAPGFRLDEANAADVARICFRLDGLPLALELAAARLGALEPAAVAARLDDRFRLLRAGSPTAPTRQQTLAATLQWSHDLLEPVEAVLYRRLAVFAGGFELDAVEAVGAGDGIEAADVADLFARLVEKSLVAVEDRDGRRRYRLLETIRADARVRLDAAGESAVVAARHAAWALERAEAEGASPALDREEANLGAALDTLLASDAQGALRLCVALWPFWLRRIDLAEAERRFAAALERAPERTLLRGKALLAATATDVRSGQMARGEERARESLDIAREVGDPEAEWRALQRLGASAITMDEAEAAHGWLGAAIDLARREGFPAREAVGIYSLGVAHWMVGEAEAAEGHVAAALERLRAVGDADEPVPAPVNMAETLSVGAGGRVAMIFEDTRQPLFELRPRQAASYVLANLANLARMRGEVARARALLDEATARFDADGDDWGRGDVLTRRAYLELEAGAPEEAERCFASALELRRRLNDRRGVGLALGGLGWAAIACGKLGEADVHLADARAIFRRAGDRWGLAGALWRTADLAFARGRPDEAEAALAEAREILAETGRSRWEAFTLSGLAEAAVLRGDVARAGELLREARARLAVKGDAVGAAAVDARLTALAKPALMERKGRRGTTSPTSTTTRRQT